jgi:hypothetical protein
MSKWRQRILLLTVLILTIIGLGFLTLQSWDTGEQFSERHVIETPFQLPTEKPEQEVGYFAALQPAEADALMQDHSPGQVNPLQVMVEGIPPIGVYLPAAGISQFSLDATLPPPTPTVNLLPNASPTPTFYPTEENLGFITATPPNTSEARVAQANGGATAVAYSGEGCAPSGLPVGGILTQRFHRWHRGIDLGVPLQTAVVATHSGEVTFAGWSRIGYGYLIILQNGPFITYYAHLTSFNVDTGDKVGRGSVIGWSGSTGNSTGPHVHYEIRLNNVEVDPLTFEQRGYSPC